MWTKTKSATLDAGEVHFHNWLAGLPHVKLHSFIARRDRMHTETVRTAMVAADEKGANRESEETRPSDAGGERHVVRGR